MTIPLSIKQHLPVKLLFTVKHKEKNNQFQKYVTNSLTLKYMYNRTKTQYPCNLRCHQKSVACEISPQIISSKHIHLKISLSYDVRHSDEAIILQFRNQLVDIFNLDACLPRRRLRHLEDIQARFNVDTQRIQLDNINFLSLCFHDIR